MLRGSDRRSVSEPFDFFPSHFPPSSLLITSVSDPGVVSRHSALHWSGTHIMEFGPYSQGLAPDLTSVFLCPLSLSTFVSY